jgi:uncharacterized protein YecT (DUF1311 family)
MADLSQAFASSPQTTVGTMESALIALAALAGLVCGAEPALAIECQNASSPVEKIICSDAALKAADQTMSAAYFKLLKATRDKEVHDLLIFSQKRWLKARDEQFQAAPGEKAETTDDDKAMVSREIGDRTKVLAGWYGAHKNASSAGPTLVEIIERQRSASQFTGGPYAGYQTDCFFAPKGYGDGAYVCVGTQSFQNRDRVCSSTTDWATDRETEALKVANIVDGKPKAVATCSDANEAPAVECPDNAELRGPWNMKPDMPGDASTSAAGSKSAPSSKYDPDASGMVRGDEKWLRACLTDPNYPLGTPANPSP